MWPDRVSNPGPLTYESGALSTALRGLARSVLKDRSRFLGFFFNIKTYFTAALHKTVLFICSNFRQFKSHLNLKCF